MPDHEFLEAFSNCNLVLTGATGFLGRPTLAGLRMALPQSARLDVCARRTMELGDDERLHWCQTDLGTETLPYHRFADADYIVWMASERDHRLSLSALWRTNVAPILDIVNRLQAGNRLRRLIYISSVSAVDQPDKQPFFPIDDASIANPTTAYGVSKLLAEDALRSSGLPVTILRLPFLYGPGYASGSFLNWYVRLAHGRVLKMLPFTGRLSLLYTGDFAELILRVMQAKNAVAADSSPYMVSDGQIYAVDDLIDRINKLFGQPTKRRSLPNAAIPLLNTALSRGPYRYWRHAAFDPNYFVVNSDRFRRNFPQITFSGLDEALMRCFL